TSISHNSASFDICSASTTKLIFQRRTSNEAHAARRWLPRGCKIPRGSTGQIEDVRHRPDAAISRSASERKGHPHPPDQGEADRDVGGIHRKQESRVLRWMFAEEFHPEVDDEGVKEHGCISDRGHA